MDARREIEALVRFEGRFAGTDAERRAAQHLRQRLLDLGRGADVEPIEVWPAYHLAHALHAGLAIVGSVLSVRVPPLGTGLVAAAAASAFADAAGFLLLVRRLTGRRASQNVLSREDGQKAGVLLLVAHYDAARGGEAFRQRLEEWRAVLGRTTRRGIGLFEPFFWSIVVILACCVLRLIGLEGTLLTVIQFVPTALLLLALPLLAEAALTEVVPGANDNASGVATALRLAEHHGRALEHFDLWVLLTGSQEASGLGMRAWLWRHRGELARDRTVLLNVDEVGSGTVRYTRREGPLLALRSHAQLVEICEEIAEDDQGHFGARGVVSRRASDAYAARLAGFPAITVTCRNALDYTPHHHKPTDTADRIEGEALERAYGFCCELIERLDAELGPRLEPAAGA